MSPAILSVPREASCWIPILKWIGGSKAFGVRPSVWNSGIHLSTQHTKIGLTPFACPAAVMVTLAAGAGYTVQVSGVDDGTGEALIELYEVL